MKSKVLALTLLAVFATSFCVPASFAQDSLLPLGPVSITVNATGTLSATTELNVDFGAGLNFTPAAGESVATASQAVQVQFTDNHAGFQSIIVSTNNPTATNSTTGADIIDSVTGLPVVRSGLITDEEDAASVPLHWVVFDTQAEAAGYNFEDNVFAAGIMQAGVDVGGKVDNTYNFYVVDRHQSDFNTPDVLGFAAVISGVSGTNGTLASAPTDVDGIIGTNSGVSRQSTDGVVYMKFGADYDGAPAASYYTGTLTLDLITM